ncbi:MAG: hypothetical protein ACRDBL_00625 [Rhabdaerophilum sp.]
MTKPKLEGKVPFDAHRVAVAHESLWMETQGNRRFPVPYSWFVAINVAKNAVGRHYTEQPKLIYVSRLIRSNRTIPRYVRTILAELIEPQAGIEHWRYHPRKRAGQTKSTGSAEWSQKLKSLASELRDSAELTADARGELAAICDVTSRATTWYLSPKRIKNATNKNKDHPVPSGLLSAQRKLMIYFSYRRRSNIPYHDIKNIERNISEITIGKNITNSELKFMKKYGDSVSWTQIISEILPQGRRAPKKMTDLEIRGAIADEYDVSIDTVNRAIKFGQSMVAESDKDRDPSRTKSQKLTPKS